MEAVGRLNGYGRRGEEALKVVMPWLKAQQVGVLARTCTSMAQAARVVSERRVGDSSQGWERIAVPVENQVDDCLYPEFQYTPFCRLPSASGHPFGGPWGGGEGEEEQKWTERKGVSESDFGGAMATGTVLHGVGIGCRCPDDCSAENQPPPVAIRNSPTQKDWAGPGSSCALLAPRDHLSGEFKKFGRGLEETSYEEQSGDRAKAQWASLYDPLKGNKYFEEMQDTGNRGSDHKSKRFPFEGSSCPCSWAMGGQAAYDSSSRLHISAPQRNEKSPVIAHHDPTGGIDEPSLVMECGQVCSCSNLCTYRVSQSGLAVRVKVVRTRFKGWGLWALQEISQGSFVCEYGGELITITEARRRQKLYDVELDGTHWGGSALLTVREHLPSGRASVRVNVDATRVGNVGRFINHSCDGGNLMPCLIRIAGCIIPKLGLFARRDIPAGEELTYSYGSADHGAGTPKLCVCGTAACLGRLPSEST